MGDVVQREVLSAIKYYENRRLGFNERILTFTISATNSYAFSALYANDTEVADVLSIDQIKVTRDGREYTLVQKDWPSLFSLDSLGTTTDIPDFWATFNKSLRLYPTPSTSLSAQVTCHVKLLSVDDATNTNSPWLNDAEDLIRSRATRNVLMRKLDDFEKAQVYSGLEAEALRSVMHDSFIRRATGILAPNF